MTNQINFTEIDAQISRAEYGLRLADECGFADIAAELRRVLELLRGLLEGRGRADE